MTFLRLLVSIAGNKKSKSSKVCVSRHTRVVKLNFEMADVFWRRWSVVVRTTLQWELMM